MDLDCAAETTLSDAVTSGDTALASGSCYVEALRPSEYTAALLRAIETRCPGQTMRRVLDVGVGSGVLLAALGRLGATELWGTDINPAAVLAASQLLRAELPGRTQHLLEGNLWAPIPADLKFDIVVANLPHFPSFLPTPNRPLYWCGGNGRATIDRLLAGLPAHLTPEGRALITHHDLIGARHTAQTLRRHGLIATDICRWTVFEGPERMVGVSRTTLAAGSESLRTYGGYSFIDARVLEIRIDPGSHTG